MSENNQLYIYWLDVADWDNMTLSQYDNLKIEPTGQYQIDQADTYKPGSESSEYDTD
jgi:hypothetical protein